MPTMDLGTTLARNPTTALNCKLDVSCFFHEHSRPFCCLGLNSTGLNSTDLSDDIENKTITAFQKVWTRIRGFEYACVHPHIHLSKFDSENRYAIGKIQSADIQTLLETTHKLFFIMGSAMEVYVVPKEVIMSNWGNSSEFIPECFAIRFKYTYQYAKAKPVVLTKFVIVDLMTYNTQDHSKSCSFHVYSEDVARNHQQTERHRNFWKAVKHSYKDFVKLGSYHSE